jgi:hypothetical protein
MRNGFTALVTWSLCSVQSIDTPKFIWTSKTAYVHILPPAGKFRSKACSPLCLQARSAFIRDMYFIFLYLYLLTKWAGNHSQYGASAVQPLLRTGRQKLRSPTKADKFFSNLNVKTGSGAHTISCTVGTGVPFSRGKARMGNNANSSPPFSAEVKKAHELYLISPQAPPWCVAALLYLNLLPKHLAYGL